MIVLKVEKSDSGETISKYIRKYLSAAPISFIYKLERNKDFKVNGVRQNKNYVLSAGEELSLYITDEQNKDFHQVTKKKEIKCDVSKFIIYEDENVILINKPRGLLVQGDNSGDVSLVDMVKDYLYKKHNENYSLGPVHRLDRNTAGIVIFSKNYETSRYFSSIINDKELIKKEYLTLVKGKLNHAGKIDYSLSKNNNGLVCIDPNGKEALTEYYPISFNDEFTLLNVTLLTGRTHQIRVHFSSINHPVIGDNKYGDFALNHEIEKKYAFKNQYLIAYKLTFGKLEKPISNLSNKSFVIKLSKEMEDILIKVKLTY